MPANHDVLGPLHTQASPRRFPPYQQQYISPAASNIFEAYKFYRAMATWACAERTVLCLERKELCEMIHLRAEEYSVEWQYNRLSPDQRAQVDRLVQDLGADYPGMIWSYVYAKENSYAKVTRNPHSNDFETTSMVIILMGRPMEQTMYRKTRMGIYVNLTESGHPNEGAMNHSRSFGVTPHWGISGIDSAGYHGTQGPHSTPTPVGLYPNQGSDSGRAVADFSTQLDSGLLPVYVNGNHSSDGILSSGSHPDQRFAHPGGALPVTDSYQMPPQLAGQHQQLSSEQSSRRSNYSRQYPAGPNVPSQKRTQRGNSDFGFSSATLAQHGEFEAPIPKRICRLREIHEAHGIQNQDLRIVLPELRDPKYCPDT